ncbi:MAG TPA: ribose 5-phosphate isomerase A [Gemmatimonadales bacterium]
MTDPNLEGKRAAALKAVERVKTGMRLGLGTGSTARIVVDEIGRRLKEGTIKNIVAVPTSVATRDQALALGIPLTTLEDQPKLDVAIDGADEVDKAGNMIKGAGGALLWEKIVARAAKRLVIVVDKSKMVERLGTKYALPVEVVAFGWGTHVEPIRALGAEPVLRMKAGNPYRTDEGHYLLDCKFADGIADAAALQDKLLARAGVVDTGLFLGFKPDVIVG